MKFEWVKGTDDEVVPLTRQEAVSLIGEKRVKKLLAAAKEFGSALSGPVKTPYDYVRAYTGVKS